MGGWRQGWVFSQKVRMTVWGEPFLGGSHGARGGGGGVGPRTPPRWAKALLQPGLSILRPRPPGEGRAGPGCGVPMKAHEVPRRQQEGPVRCSPCSLQSSPRQRPALFLAPLKMCVRARSPPRRGTRGPRQPRSGHGKGLQFRGGVRAEPEGDTETVIFMNPLPGASDREGFPFHGPFWKVERLVFH